MTIKFKKKYTLSLSFSLTASEDIAIEGSSFEITPDLNKLVLDFFEKSNSTIVTKPKIHHYNRNNRSNHQQHSNYNHHNSNFSQLSPPLSPQQQFNNFHQQQHNRYQQQFSTPQNKFVSSDHQYYNNWDYNQHKVRAQC